MTSDNPDKMLSDGPLVYLDTGEIFRADEDGFPIDDSLVAVLSGSGEMDRLGNLFAAAPDLAEALRKIMNAHASNVMFHNRALAERAWTALSRLNP